MTTPFRASSLLAAGNFPVGAVRSPLYMDPSGDDRNDGLSPSTPVQTWARLFELIPYVIDANIDVYLAAGTYPRVSFPPRLCVGSPIVQFLGAQAEVAPGLTPTVWTAGTQTVTFTPDPGWSVDEHVGRFLRVRYGTSSEVQYPIYSNTSDTLTLAVNKDSHTGITDCSIVDNLVTVDAENVAVTPYAGIFVSGWIGLGHLRFKYFDFERCYQSAARLWANLGLTIRFSSIRLPVACTSFQQGIYVTGGDQVVDIHDSFLDNNSVAVVANKGVSVGIQRSWLKRGGPGANVYCGVRLVDGAAVYFAYGVRVEGYLGLAETLVGVPCGIENKTYGKRQILGSVVEHTFKLGSGSLQLYSPTTECLVTPGIAAILMGDGTTKALGDPTGSETTAFTRWVSA